MYQFTVSGWNTAEVHHKSSLALFVVDCVPVVVFGIFHAMLLAIESWRANTRGNLMSLSRLYSSPGTKSCVSRLKAPAGLELGTMDYSSILFDFVKAMDEDRHNGGELC